MKLLNPMNCPLLLMLQICDLDCLNLRVGARPADGRALEALQGAASPSRAVIDLFLQASQLKNLSTNAAIAEQQAQNLRRI